MMNIFRQIVLFVGILLMGCALQAQNVEFIADWHPGDVFKYNVSKIVQKDNAIDTLNYTMVMTVVDSTEEKYHIKMVYDGLYNNPILDTLLDGKLSFKDYEILQTVYYSTNNVGEVIEIENADTLIKSIFKYTDALMSAIGDDASDKVTSTLKSLYNKDYLLSSVYKEISLIHSVLGYSYPLNKPIKAKVKVENTLTGGFFDAKTFVAIEEFDPERQFCRIRVNTEYDSKQLGKAVVDLLKSFGMDKKELKQSRFRLSKVDEEVYEYLAYPGILLHADFSRGTMLTSSTEAPSGKIERYIITLNQP